MRLVYFVLLAAFGGAAALLAYENQREVTLTFFNQSISTSVPILVGLTYLAGMLSGWTVVGLLRRTIHKAWEHPRAHGYDEAPGLFRQKVNP